MHKQGAQSNTYRKANWALGVTALGLVAAYPFQTQFWGGLVTSGCSAGLVGGLADWFAVTALFRKPLGIRPGRVFRTAIIPRNRERIFQELSHMVQDELLSEEALTKKLTGLDFAVLLEKLTDAPGLARLEPSANALVTCFFASVNQSEEESFSRKYADLEKDQSFRCAISQILREVFKLSLAKGTVQNVLEVLVQELSLWTQSPEMHRTLKKWIDDALADYVNENSSRKIVQMFLPESSTIAMKIQMQVANALTGGQAVRAALEWLENFIQGSRFDELLSQVLPGLMKNGEKSLLTQIQTKLSDPESTQKLTESLLKYIENYRLELEGNADKRAALNLSTQTLLFQIIAGQHDRIGRFVREGLEKYSDEMLVDLIEAKAGADLQMIRINGSVVGAFAGILFYLVNFLL